MAKGKKNKSNNMASVIYKANLTQEDTNVPNAIIGVDTITGIVWTRASAGIYYGTKTGAFPEGKTHLFIGSSISPIQHVSLQYNDENIVVIETKVFSGGVWTPTDYILYLTSVEIEVYL